MDIAEQIRTDPEGGSRRLVAELGAGLWALALRLCGNRADAEDLYVRTLETAVAKIAEQRGPFFSAWLRAICLNLRRSDLRRSDLPADRSVAPESIPGESPTPLDETAARAYAAAELLHTTGERKYLDDFRACVPWTVYPDAPGRVHGRYEALEPAGSFVRDPKNEKRDPELWARVRAAVVREADFYIEGSDQMAYKFIRHPDAPINWGTGAYGNSLQPILDAWFLTGDRKYRDWTIRTCDNMLGANPLGLCWITGLGERTIRAPLHNSRYRPEGEVADGQQAEGPWARGGGYNFEDTVYPKHDPLFAPMHNHVDCHFAIGMDEGVVNHQALDMAVLGLLLPDAK